MQLESHHLGQQHRHRLAEHHCLRLDPPDAPAEHAEAVDHRGVRVGADKGVRIRSRQLPAFVHEDHAREVLEVHLVADAGIGRNDREVVERALTPAQERVALAITLELAFHVDGKSVVSRERVDLNRVVDDELGRNERVDLAADRRRASTIASRIAARSTTPGTPVKSCISTRAGENAISCSARRPRPSSAIAATSAALTAPLPSVRSRFSSRTFSENGSRATS